MIDSSGQSTKISFYGGIHEIGGNKFLVEDKGTRIFLDFGNQMGREKEYFSEYTKPRTLNGMGDLFEFGLLPRLKGLYRRDYANHMDFGGNEDTAFDAVLLTHAHVDHAAYIHYLRPDIPIYCTEATKIILQALQETSADGDEYITFKESFHIHKNERSGEMVRTRGGGESLETARSYVMVEPFKKFKIDSIEVEPLPVDHSVPGVCGFILYTSKGTIAYTADIRFHGRRAGDSEKFVDSCGAATPDILLCEGTRVAETFTETEMQVEEDTKSIIEKTEKLVVCSYPTRDLDRLLSFYNAAKSSGRVLVIDMKQAYLLKLFQKSEYWKSVYPAPDGKYIQVYIPRKKWGILGKDLNTWTRKILDEDYQKWEQEFLDYQNRTDYLEVSSHQKELVFSCNDFQLKELIDVRPESGSQYIRSTTEPFDDEMEISERRVFNWLVHFGLVSKKGQLSRSHVSGHGDGTQIKKVIEGARSKKLVPIHTEHENYHKMWHPNVKVVKLNGNLELK
jgi:ribonuclease J